MTAAVRQLREPMPLTPAELDLMGSKKAREDARKHLASLSPERRRHLEREWA